VIAAVAAITALGTTAASAAVIQVRPGDMVLVPGTISGTTGTAKADFLAEGIRIHTDNQDDGARGYYLIPGGTPLADVHTVQYEWIGTPNGQPGMAYNIDIDGDNRPDVQLIGEAAYGGKDVWLNRDAEDFTGVTPTVPAGYFATRAPCADAVAQPGNGNQDGCGSSGYTFHGTLDDWVRSLALVGKTGRVVSAGFIAVGLFYDGVLRSQTVGPNQYVFTNLPAPADTCARADVTIPGTPGNDFIVGTSGPDVIDAGDGDDIVKGLGGNDTICGGNGNDKLKGGGGRDKLYGEVGRDKLRGGADKDYCNGGLGLDSAKRCENTQDI
jgi:Ca2+-binding RTX toxin-like protein